MDQPIRMLLAKIGLDTHTIGVTVLAKELRDRGFEVIFSGLKQTPEKVAMAALQEDVDVIGVSCLSGGYLTHLKLLSDKLREFDLDDRVLIVGGVVPEEDVDTLKSYGVDQVFTMGANIDDIAQYLREAVQERA